MQFPLKSLALGLCLAGAVHASLRARLCQPVQYLTGSDSSAALANGASNQSHDPNIWATKVDPGVWDGYDPVKGFDNVTDAKGTLPAGNWVTASFWEDSIAQDFDPTGAGFARDMDQPLVDLSGFFVMLYGQITLPASGDYQWISQGNNPGPTGLRVWIDWNNDGSFNDSEEIKTSVPPADSVTLPYPLIPGATKKELQVARIFKRTCQAGKYRIRAWKWTYGGSLYCALDWKLPGADKFAPVPASAFGTRRQFGPPSVNLDSLQADGHGFPASAGLASATVGNPVTLYATAANMQGQPAKYIWIWDTGVQDTTTENHGTHTYGSAGLKFPTVKVMRGGAVSGVAAQTVLLNVQAGSAVKGVAGARGWRWEGASLRLAAAGGTPVRVRVTSLDGGQVAERPARVQGGEAVADLSGLPRGAYLVRVYRAGQLDRVLPASLGM